jgi:hypothetical protein
MVLIKLSACVIAVDSYIFMHEFAIQMMIDEL